MTLAIDLRSGAATVACYVGEALGAFLVLAWRVAQDVAVCVPLLTFWCAVIVGMAEPQVLSHVFAQGLDGTFIRGWVFYMSLFTAFLALPVRAAFSKARPSAE